MIRALVVDDSLTIRKWIVEVLEGHPKFEVIGEAKNGKEAIHLAEELKPDVITMDMMMPEMTGVSATEYIMAHCPTRILIVSASTNRGELMKTYDALAAGALSVVDKPNGTGDIATWEKALIEELLIVSRVPVVRHIRGKQNLKSQKSLISPPSGTFRAIVMGASTGGPQALLKIFQELPTLGIPILCVLHISPVFATSLDEWFTMNSNLRVKFAKDGDRLFAQGNPNVFLAPADHHLAVEGNTLRLYSTPLVNFCRPSVDVLFESAARQWGENLIGILLTGMGKDGALGLKTIRDAKGYTIAQDEESSVVFGMPDEAIKLGAAVKVLPYTDIPNEILRLTQ